MTVTNSIVIKNMQKQSIENRSEIADDMLYKMLYCLMLNCFFGGTIIVHGMVKKYSAYFYYNIVRCAKERYIQMKEAIHLETHFYK